MEEQSHKVDECNLGSLLCSRYHFDKLVNGILRHVVQLEPCEPLFEVINWAAFLLDGVRFNELLDKLSHFVDVGHLVEGLRLQMSWFELFESHFVMGMCTYNLSLWDLT